MKSNIMGGINYHSSAQQSYLLMEMNMTTLVMAPGEYQ